MEIGEKIKELCKTKGIALSALEKELGWGNGYISKVKQFPFERVLEVSQYFGVPIEYFITKNDYYLDTEAGIEMQLLMDDEKALLDGYRRLDKKTASYVRTLIKTMTDTNPEG